MDLNADKNVIKKVYPMSVLYEWCGTTGEGLKEGPQELHRVHKTGCLYVISFTCRGTAMWERYQKKKKKKDTSEI